MSNAGIGAALDARAGRGVGRAARRRVVGVDGATVARNWWAVALRGVAALSLGVLTVAVPRVTLAGLVLLFGGYTLLDGALYIVTALRRRGTDPHWTMLLLAGVAGITAGALTLWYPGVTALALVYLVAGWAVVTGVAQLVAAVRLRTVLRGEWLLAVSGMLALLVGLCLAADPRAGVVALALWVGAYAFVAGLVLVMLGLRLRRYRTLDA